MSNLSGDGRLYQEKFSHLTGEFQPDHDSMERHTSREQYYAVWGNHEGLVEYGTMGAAWDCFHGRTHGRTWVWRITFVIDGIAHRGFGFTRDEAYKNVAGNIQEWLDGVPF